MTTNSLFFKLTLILAFICLISCNTGDSTAKNIEIKERAEMDNKIPANATDCNDLPETFSSYSEAINAVENASFLFTDELPDGKSSWISEAKYYSCNGEIGWMIYRAGSKKYIHKGLPIDVWKAFKNASSSGSYYDYHIKHSYRFVPSQ